MRKSIKVREEDILACLYRRRVFGGSKLARCAVMREVNLTALLGAGPKSLSPRAERAREAEAEG